MRCPCRKKTEATLYVDCCAPYHTGARLAPTAEALMRSRYSAFALSNTVYLLATWHPSTRPAQLDLMLDQQWQLLRILATATAGDTATVEFTARSRIGGTSHVLHEISRFVREGDRWFYLSGAIK